MSIRRRRQGSLRTPGLIFTLLSIFLSACQAKELPMDVAALKEFATQYTSAWCSQNAASVAAFFAPTGSLKINAGDPAVGREAIAASAQGFMTTFPDLVVKMDSLTSENGHAVFHWTVTGTNTAPCGTGKSVRFSGYEVWTIGADGLIAESKGHFDEADYARQLKEGVTADR